MRTAPGSLRYLCSAAIFTLATTLSTAAFADDTARARELFQQGVSLEMAGNFVEALKKFNEVAAVRKTPQVLYHIALCHERLNQLVEAASVYRSASTLAAAGAGSDPKLAEVQKTVEDSLVSVEKRIAQLTIKRGNTAREATVQLDGAKLEIDQLGKPMKVNPGKHTISAKARGKDNFREELTLGDGESKSLTVEMTSLEEGAPPPPKDQAAPEPEGSSSSKVLKFTGFSLMGLGAVSLGAGGVFFLLRNSADSELRNTCAGTTCPTSARETYDRAQTMNTLTNVTVIAGASALATGLVLVLVAPSDPEPESKKTSVRLRLETSSSLLGASLGGNF